MEKSGNILRRLALVLFALVLPVIGYTQRWNLYDYWRLRGYTPPARVVTLADETSVNQTGRRLFYVNKPSLDSKESFRAHCTTSEQTIVLGCFVPYQGIYLQDINDERLTGVMQVTAAHEMLHAAYQRLGVNEKKDLDTLLDEAFSKVDNSRIKETIEDYKKAGADIHNELHSILGTEVSNLPAGLEAHYKKYFNDRSKVVTFSAQYEAAFTSRKNQAAEYQKQLASLKQQIDAVNASLETQQAALESRQADLNGLSAANKINEYNAAVPGFNKLVNAYNASVGRVRSLIDRHNELVKLHNEIVLEENELVKAIDSRPNTVNTQ